MEFDGPRYPRRGSRALLSVLVWFLTTSCLGMGHTSMNSDLEHSAPGPRSLAVVAQSWSGSSQALVSAACDLLNGTGELVSGNSAVLWFKEPASPTGYRVVGAFGFTSSLSVNAIQQRLRAIEAVLNPDKIARSGGALKLDLTWVEGVRARTPEIVLPSPDILDQPWAMNTFLASSETDLAQACEENREDRDFCVSVGRAARGAPRAQDFELGLDMWLGGKATPSEIGVKSNAHVGEADILAAGFEALLVLAEAHANLTAAHPVDLHRLIPASTRAVASRGANRIVPVVADLPQGTPSDRLGAWLDALRRIAAQSPMTPRRAVVFDLSGTQARGALLGLHREDGARTVLPVPDKMSIASGGGESGEPRNWTVVLRMNSDPATAPK